MARSLPAGLAERGQRAVTAQRLMSALLADVGGTNARFALLRDGTLGSVIHLMVADHPSAYDAVAAALARLGAPQAPPAPVLAFAGPVYAGRATLNNSAWAPPPPAL